MRRREIDNAGPESITGSTTIDELMMRYPSAAQVFIQRRMHCVGCDIDRFHTVADACRIYRQPLWAFLDELHRISRASGSPAAA